MLLPRDIGRMVRFHRKKAKLSQLELAQLSGVGKTVVFDVEKGKESIRLSTLMKLLHTLNITIDFSGPLMDLFQNKVGSQNVEEKLTLPKTESSLCFDKSVMKKANVYVNGVYAGDLEEIVKGKEYRFTYVANYCGDAVSLTMPVSQSTYIYPQFPPFFAGLLPEGPMLEALLKKKNRCR